MEIIHALQIEPRATWTALAPVVQRDAANIARRWARLSDEGLCWVTGLTHRRQSAVVQVACDPLSFSSNVRILERDPAVWVLDHCSSEHDLVAIVTVDDIAALARATTERFGGLVGVLSLRVHPIERIVSDGTRWRLNALPAARATAIRPARGPRKRSARRVSEDLRGVIEHELWRDGRASAAAIAERHGFSPQRVTDAIALLRAQGELIIRIDVARMATATPVSTWYFLEVPAEVLERADVAIHRLPHVRAAMITASRFNLILAAWLPTLADFNRFEMELTRMFPGAHVADRCLVLRAHRNLSRRLREDSCAESDPVPRDDVRPGGS